MTVFKRVSALLGLVGIFKFFDSLYGHDVDELSWGCHMFSYQNELKHKGFICGQLNRRVLRIISLDIVKFLVKVYYES